MWSQIARLLSLYVRSNLSCTATRAVSVGNAFMAVGLQRDLFPTMQPLEFG